jgi:hypothetical protein
MNISDVDKAAIKQTALDYIESWYAGDAERMDALYIPNWRNALSARIRKGKAISTK